MENDLIVHCPNCGDEVQNLLKHLIEEHDLKMCNACEKPLEEKRCYLWTKDGGGLKAHWSSKHRADFTFCNINKCVLPMTPAGETHTCEYK